MLGNSMIAAIICSHLPSMHSPGPRTRNFPPYGASVASMRPPYASVRA